MNTADADMLPPHDPTAEVASLACIVSGDGEASSRLKNLSLADFYDHRHRTIYIALNALNDAGKTLDVPTLYANLRDSGKLEEAGGFDFIQRLPDATPSPEHFPSWLEIVKQFAQRRADLVESERLKERALVGVTATGETRTETDGQIFERLAKLSRPDYDRCRESEAKKLGLRVGTLDDEVAKLRPKNETETIHGTAVTFPVLEPWPKPVYGAELLNEISVIIERFVVAPTSAIVAAALFVLHTYSYDLGDISPILFITGPTKRCGKSKFLAILLRLVSKPFAAASATAAGIYRLIELFHPTVGIDEVDSFVRGDEQLRGLMDSGHTRDAAFHLGCALNGDDYEPRRWSTWSPKIFSGIGRLADTIEDRAIIIGMVRRRKNEPTDRLRHGMKFDDVGRKALRFVQDNESAIRNANPVVPDGLHDRAADNWTPLLILADLAEGDWPKMAREAAIALSGGDDGESLGLPVQLLADIKTQFIAARADKLSSAELAEKLAQIEGHPWAEYGKARRPISKNQIAGLLRAFGVQSRSIRIGDESLRGYALDDFSDAFSRYLPETPHSKCDNATTLVNSEQNRDFQDATENHCRTPGNCISSTSDAQCRIVADVQPEIVEADML